jgi:hypothetical protein
VGQLEFELGAVTIDGKSVSRDEALDASGLMLVNNAGAEDEALQVYCEVPETGKKFLKVEKW